MMEDAAVLRNDDRTGSTPTDHQALKQCHYFEKQNFFILKTEGKLACDLKLTKQVKTSHHVELKNEKQSPVESNDKSCVNTDKEKMVGSCLTVLAHNASAGL